MSRYITTGNAYPGILSLLWYKPSTGRALSALAQQILLGPSALTPGERETIAAYTSALNECNFCCASHNGAANCHLHTSTTPADYLRPEFLAAQTPRMQALLQLAAQVQRGGRHVTQECITAAKQSGASDDAIHDTVIVAAAFCMYNRYVDGLGTREASPADYAETGVRLATKGYTMPPVWLQWLVRRVLNARYPA